MRSETTSVNFLYSFVFKSIKLSCSLNGSGTHIGHQALVIWKIVVYSVTQIFKMLTHFIIQYLKAAFIHITTNFMGKIFKYWKAVKLIVVAINFPNSNFHLKALFFPLATNTQLFM